VAAIWFSDRWTWTLPGLAGVLASVWLSRWLQRARVRGQPLAPLELGPSLILLLVLTSFAYLGVLFLVLQFGMAFDPYRAAERSALGPLLSFAGLFLLLLAVGALAVTPRPSRPLLALWDWLLRER
jgi:hypothetical protein